MSFKPSAISRLAAQDCLRGQILTLDFRAGLITLS
jgi:hypothetical protein